MFGWFISGMFKFRLKRLEEALTSRPQMVKNRMKVFEGTKAD